MPLVICLPEPAADAGGVPGWMISHWNDPIQRALYGPAGRAIAVSEIAVCLSHNVPSEVCFEEGEVILEGPGGLVISLSPEAAIETADRLLNAGLEGKGHQIHQDFLRGAGRLQR